MGADSKREKSDREAYDFCRKVYEETGGATPALRRAFDFYRENYQGGCDPLARAALSPQSPVQPDDAAVTTIGRDAT